MVGALCLPASARSPQTTDDPSDRVLQIAIPIIPKHIWGKETYKTIGEGQVRRRRSSGPARIRSSTGRPASSSASQRNPNYWGTQAFADEVDIIIYKTADTMVQALKAGELDYAHGPNAEQLNQLKTDPNIETVAGSANGWSQLAFNGYGGEHRQDDPERRTVDQGPARPEVPRRPRVRGRPQGARRPGARRIRRRRHRRSCRRC